MPPTSLTINLDSYLYIIIFIVFAIISLAAIRHGAFPTLKIKWGEIIGQLGWSHKTPIAATQQDEATTEASSSPGSLEIYSSNTITDYKINLTKECLEQIKKLALTKEKLIEMVQNEFKSHVNYFKFDLSDYGLPIQKRYIVFIDKHGKYLSFNSIAACTKDQAKLSAWSDILSLYRQASRMAYRQQPEKIVLVNGLFTRTNKIHEEIIHRIISYFSTYYDAQVDPLTVSLIEDLGSECEYSGSLKKESIHEIAFHIREASKAISESLYCLNDFQMGLTSQNEATRDIVISLERSLQHIHKIISSIPPMDL